MGTHIILTPVQVLRRGCTVSEYSGATLLCSYLSNQEQLGITVSEQSGPDLVYLYSF